MPIDSREKRNSATAFLLPFYAAGIDPGTLDQAERQASVWVYSGILAVSTAVGQLALRRLGGFYHARPYGVRGVQVFAPYEHLDYGMAN